MWLLLLNQSADIKLLNLAYLTKAQKRLKLMVHLQRPYTEDNNQTIFLKKEKGIFPFMDAIPDEGELKDLLYACLQFSKEGRPSMAEVVAWLQAVCMDYPVPLQ